VNKNVSSLILVVVAGILVASSVETACADSLELKSGQIIQGKFVGGSPMNIRFQVNGNEQVFATRDVLNIGFSDTSVDASTSAAPAVPQAGSSDAPKVDAPNPPPTAAAAEHSAQGTQAIRMPAGTAVLVRMIDSVDSSKNAVGDSFHASLETALTAGDTVVAPKGADVYGKLAQARDAGKISGAAELTLELTGIRIDGNVVPLETSDYDVAGSGRGKQSAERIGGGAIVGAIIGGVVGGGKGAAIGAGVGAGAGTAAQVMTHGQQVRVPSETLLEFKLQHDVLFPLPNSSSSREPGVSQ
jgi:hypothetical protein